DYSVFNLSPPEVNKYLITGDFGVIYRQDKLLSKVCAPIKLGEYLASGLPILCTSNIGDTDKIAKEYNIGVIFSDKVEISNKLEEIIKLTKDPEVKLRCRRVAEQELSLKNSAQKYEFLYRSLKI